MSDLSQVEVLATARNLALLKLGRNIHNFGLVEQGLKYLVTASDITTIGDNLDKQTSKKIDKSKKTTLGQLISDILETWHPDNLSDKPRTEDIFDIRISTSFRIEMDLDNYNSLKQSLDDLLKDRNYLVHEFSKDFPLNSTDNCNEAVIYLDENREKHLSVMESIRSITNSHLEASKVHAAFINSDEFWSYYEP